MAISMDSMPQLVRDFATYKLTIQGCSRKTVDEYVSDLRLFVRYIYGKRCGIKIPSDAFEGIDISSLKTDFFEAITTDEIYDFFVYLSNIVIFLDSFIRCACFCGFSLLKQENLSTWEKYFSKIVIFVRYTGR